MICPKICPPTLGQQFRWSHHQSSSADIEGERGRGPGRAAAHTSQQQGWEREGCQGTNAPSCQWQSRTKGTSQMPPRAASGRVNTLLPSYCISSMPHSLFMCHCAAGNGQMPSTVGQKGRNSLLEEAPFPCSGTELGPGLSALGELHPLAPHAFSSLSPAKLTCGPPAQLPCSASDPAVRPGL